MQPPLQLFYTNSWKQLLCCSVLLGQCQSRTHQVVAPALWAVWRIAVTFHPHLSAGNSRMSWLQNTGEVFFFYCALGEVQKWYALSISTYKAKQEKPWLAVMMCTRMQGQAQCLDVLLSIFSWAVLSAFNKSINVHLHIVLCIKVGRGEANYLSSPERSKRQDLLVLIIK